MYYQVGVKLVLNYLVIVIIINRFNKFLKNKAHSKPSWDILHSLTPDRWADYYLIPDYFVIMNTLLFVPELYHFDRFMIEDVSNVFIALHWIRLVAIGLTAMPSPTPPGKNYGFFSTEHDLILSGHNIQSLLTTLIIGQVSRSYLVIILSWMCAIGNMFSSILNRHHYTIDVYLTIIIVYLTYQQYLVPID